MLSGLVLRNYTQEYTLELAYLLLVNVSNSIKRFKLRLHAKTSQNYLYYLNYSPSCLLMKGSDRKLNFKGFLLD